MTMWTNGSGWLQIDICYATWYTCFDLAMERARTQPCYFVRVGNAPEDTTHHHKQCAGCYGYIPTVEAVGLVRTLRHDGIHHDPVCAACHERALALDVEFRLTGRTRAMSQNPCAEIELTR